MKKLAALTLIALLTNLIVPSPIAAQQPPPNVPTTWVPAPPPPGSTCSNCGNVHWVDENGVDCKTYTCRGPGWPQCMDSTRPTRCTPGNSVELLQCTGMGVDRCRYTCDSSGIYRLASCQQVGNNINRQIQFCDYNAGCGVSNGYLSGRLTTVAELCTQDGIQQQTVSQAACGGVCSRRLVCKPGQPCYRPGEPPQRCNWRSGVGDLVPTCDPSGSGYECKFGPLTISANTPCPTVSRSPYPRAIVGKPITLHANACGNLPSTSGRVDVPEPWDDWGDTIVAYEGSIGWQCTNADSAGVEWSMDERAWNVGHIGSDGKLILANRSGASVAHVYETSSYDLQPNGPGPNGNHQQPSYQVEVKTRYSLVGAFKYQYRAQEHRCYWGPNQTDGQKQCYNAGNCLGDPNAAAREDCKPDGSNETVIITPTRELPAIVIPDITITGAKSAQDPVGADICGPIVWRVGGGGGDGAGADESGSGFNEWGCG